MTLRSGTVPEDASRRWTDIVFDINGCLAVATPEQHHALLGFYGENKIIPRNLPQHYTEISQALLDLLRIKHSDFGRRSSEELVRLKCCYSLLLAEYTAAPKPDETNSQLTNLDLDL